jgi:hypothetical protein
VKEKDKVEEVKEGEAVAAASAPEEKKVDEEVKSDEKKEEIVAKKDEVAEINKDEVAAIASVASFASAASAAVLQKVEEVSSSLMTFTSSSITPESKTQESSKGTNAYIPELYIPEHYLQSCMTNIKLCLLSPLVEEISEKIKNLVESMSKMEVMITLWTKLAVLLISNTKIHSIKLTLVVGYYRQQTSVKETVQEMSESVIEKVESMKTIVKETMEEVLTTETITKGVKDKNLSNDLSFHFMDCNCNMNF